ncbi:MAG: cell division transport system permease protein [Sphingomonadales bacterium]|nr:cell division transport system permease protein [Sphingomonadales bacterium]
MMLDWFFVSPAEGRLLGATARRAPTPWVIAIMSFSIMLIAATGLALANTAGVLSRAIEARYALEVPGGGNLDALLATVRDSPGVTSAEAVPETDMRKTLERWLGPEAQSRELPVPALVNFDVTAGANLNAIQQRAMAIAPGARIVAHRDSIAPLLHSLTLLQWVAFGLVVLLSAAAAAAVVLAARGALDTHRFTIEVLHGVGATDLQVTHLFQRKIAIDALIGSVAGASAAAVVLLLLTTGATFAGELTGGATLGIRDLLILALLPLALTALATWVARTAVLRALREAL